MKDHDTTDDIPSKTVQMLQTNRCAIIPAATHWVTFKIGINGLGPDLYQNKHKINPEYIQIE
jgi:hypothetical protein